MTVPKNVTKFCDDDPYEMDGENWGFVANSVTDHAIVSPDGIVVSGGDKRRKTYRRQPENLVQSALGKLVGIQGTRCIIPETSTQMGQTSSRSKQLLFDVAVRAGRETEGAALFNRLKGSAKRAVEERIS